uniref:Uncharacterized protein n=1 Tax=Arundo donax TaxID=35708 RepID=A0A0A9ESH1_ARUDO
MRVAKLKIASDCIKIGSKEGSSDCNSHFMEHMEGKKPVYSNTNLQQLNKSVTSSKKSLEDMLQLWVSAGHNSSSMARRPSKRHRLLVFWVSLLSLLSTI